MYCVTMSPYRFPRFDVLLLLVMCDECGGNGIGFRNFVGLCPLIGVRDRLGYHLGQSCNEEEGGIILPKVVLSRGGQL